MVRYAFKCKDMGYENCSYEISEDDRNYVLSKVKMHAKYAHGKTDFTDELKQAVEKVIREVEE